MTEKEFEILNHQGLHARPATALVSLASKFESDIFLIRDDKKINAKSILGVLVLAAEHGSKLKIQALGVDEEEAAEAIIELSKDHFGMDEKD
ncbi:MAG: HPr family phosphocarrier protein [Candidatus Marinimicrobia bacterium]|jgi:phosphocarrier protein HPr|nr:HPr family phosphocarrier protein [Candidatus Neomarinimicrobiota bacterium]